MNRAELLERAVSVYGEHRQVDMMIEEMSELTKALLKIRRAATPNEMGEWIVNVAEEIADVQIALDQMKMFFTAEGDAFESMKLARLAERLGEEYDG